MSLIMGIFASTQSSFDVGAVGSAMDIILRFGEVRPRLYASLKPLVDHQDSSLDLDTRAYTKKKFCMFKKLLDDLKLIARDFLCGLENFGHNAEMLEDFSSMDRDQVASLLRSQLDICIRLLKHTEMFNKAKEASNELDQFLRSWGYLVYFISNEKAWMKATSLVISCVDEFNSSLAEVPLLTEEARLAEFKSDYARNLFQLIIFLHKQSSEHIQPSQFIKDARTLSLLQTGRTQSECQRIKEEWTLVKTQLSDLKSIGIHLQRGTQLIEEICTESANLAEYGQEVFKLVKEFQCNPTEDSHKKFTAKLDQYRQKISQCSTTLHELQENVEKTIEAAGKIKFATRKTGMIARIWAWLSGWFTSDDVKVEEVSSVSDTLLKCCLESINKLAAEVHATCEGVQEIQRRYRDCRSVQSSTASANGCYYSHGPEACKYEAQNTCTVV